MTRTRVERARRALFAAFDRTGDLTSPAVIDASRRVDRLLVDLQRASVPAGEPGPDAAARGRAQTGGGISQRGEGVGPARQASRGPAST